MHCRPCSTPRFAVVLLDISADLHMCCDAAMAVASEQQVPAPQSPQLLCVQLQWMSCMLERMQDLNRLADATCHSLTRLALLADVVCRVTGAGWPQAGDSDAFVSAMARLRAQPRLQQWLLVWLVVCCCRRADTPAAVDALGRPGEERELLLRCAAVHSRTMERLCGGGGGGATHSLEQPDIRLSRDGVRPLLQAYESIAHDAFLAHVDAVTGVGVVSTLLQVVSQYSRTR